jgi:hypothetical protein
MNSTSFGERGGSAALVDDGSIRVGCPGAPGCTTTGETCESACCAQIGSDMKQKRALKAMSEIRRVAAIIIDSKLSLALKENN